MRWMNAIIKFGDISFGFDLVYLSRIRSFEVREQMISDVYNRVFSEPWAYSIPLITASASHYKIGKVILTSEVETRAVYGCRLYFTIY